MIDDNNCLCTCDTCSGADCTCGCQDASAETACECGPLCACGIGCNCANCSGEAK